MGQPIQRARAALRAMHRLETLRSNTEFNEDDVEAAASVMRSDAVDIDQPLLEEHDQQPQDNNGQREGAKDLAFSKQQLDRPLEQNDRGKGHTLTAGPLSMCASVGCS